MPFSARVEFYLPATYLESVVDEVLRIRAQEVRLSGSFVGLSTAYAGAFSPFSGVPDMVVRERVFGKVDSISWSSAPYIPHSSTERRRVEAEVENRTGLKAQEQPKQS